MSSIDKNEMSSSFCTSEQSNQASANDDGPGKRNVSPDMTTPNSSIVSSQGAAPIQSIPPDGTNHESSWESGVATKASTSNVILKVLVSNNNAGSIIGKSGRTISEMQQQSAARIRLSQAGDFFPGTNDRICLICGSIETVKTAVSLVLEKLHLPEIEADSLNLLDRHHDSLDDLDTKYKYAARILIPAAACGMLLGKEGATIKKMKEDAGASSVRLSPKVTDHFIPRTFERILTVSGGTLESCVTFTKSIIDGFTRHPETCHYLNSTTSYHQTTHPSISTSPVLRYSASPPQHPSGFIQHPATLSLIQDIDIGVQALRLGGTSPVRGHNLPGFILSTPMNSPTTTHSPMQKQTSSIQIFVPNSIIGAILGPRGKTLVELQKRSDTIIKVSQKDEFVPGTNDRVVTIIGPMANINVARSLIEQILTSNYK